MEVLTLSSLQHYVPASEDASEDVKGRKLINVAFFHHDSNPNGPIPREDFTNLSQSGSPFDGNNLSEYFGLAMAICAVGLLRNACPGFQVLNSRFLKEASQNRDGQRVGMPFDLVPNSALSDKEVDPNGKSEQSIILQKISHLQVQLLQLKRLRSEDGKANERVVSIFASKEQDWKIERRKFQEQQHKLYHELQRAFLQQEALHSQIEHLRSLQKQPCPQCVHREGLSVELKERLGEQEFLIMATMEEVQTERQEKNAIAEKLTAIELSLSQLQEKLSVDAEHHALELAKRDELIIQLESRAKQSENENSRILQELNASQASLSAITDEKIQCKELISVTSRKISQLQVSVQRKDDIVSAMLKKANADAEDRKGLATELAFMKAKLDQAQKEKQEEWRRLVPMNTRSSSNTETFKPMSRFETRSAPLSIQELQTLHDAEIKSLQTVFEEQVQMLQRRLSLYQERVADLEEDILLSLTTTRSMIRCDEHATDILDDKCITALNQCIEAELVSKQFQLSVAKTLIKQFVDLEIDREQEAERWKKLYFASKATVGLHMAEDYPGTGISRWSSKLQDWLKLEKSRHTYNLEKRHWQEIDAFERQMRARDERMEAFRCLLLHMEGEVQNTHRELENLKQSLATACDDRRRLEEMLKKKEDELVACQVNALATYASWAYENNHKEEICNLKEKVASLQTMLLEREMEYDLSLTTASSQAECELEEAECKLAVAEAQLVQSHLIREGERGGEKRGGETSSIVKEREKSFRALSRYQLPN